MGGINTYGYAYQNPVMYTDPKGLSVATGALCFILGIGWVGCGVAAVGGAILVCAAGGCQLISNAVSSIWNAMCSDSAEEEQCRRVYENCANDCANIFADDPESLPGSGRDYASRLRRCVSDCARDAGC
jgi:hypothetical protein